MARQQVDRTDGVVAGVGNEEDVAGDRQPIRLMEAGVLGRAVAKPGTPDPIRSCSPPRSLQTTNW
ncbi:MAG: hypothetical protein ACRDJ4_02185 [Actinomycetota bacterium]